VDSWRNELKEQLLCMKRKDEKPRAKTQTVWLIQGAVESAFGLNRGKYRGVLREISDEHHGA